MKFRARHRAKRSPSSAGRASFGMQHAPRRVRAASCRTKSWISCSLKTLGECAWSQFAQLFPPSPSGLRYSSHFDERRRSVLISRRPPFFDERSRQLHSVAEVGQRLTAPREPLGVDNCQVPAPLRMEYLNGPAVQRAAPNFSPGLSRIRADQRRVSRFTADRKAE